MVRNQSVVKLLLALLAGTLWFGCGGDDAEPGEVQSPASIVSFQANPAHLDEPGTTLLSWETNDAIEVRIHRDGVDLDPDEALPHVGSVEVLLERSTTFELVAIGSFGSPATETITVVVDPFPTPAIASFTAPERVAADEAGFATISLSWSGVSDAEELVLEVSDRAPITLDASAIPAGSHELEIDADTSFTLIARGDGGEAVATAETRLVAYPVIESFTVDRDWVGLGETIVLSWETTGTAAVELRQDDLPLDDLDETLLSGSFEHVPTVPSTFELIVTNELGVEVASSLEVFVGLPEIESFAGTEMARWLGQPLELSWVTHGGRSVQLLVGDDPEPICASEDLDVVDASSCPWELPAVGDYLFTLVVENASGQISRPWGVSAGTGPVIASFDTDREAITLGEELLLSWRTIPDPDGEEPSLELRDDRGASYPATASQGSARIRPEALGSYEFSLRATTSNPLSIADEASLSIVVYGAPSVSLSAFPLHFDEAEANHVTFSWTSEHASSLKLFLLGEDGEDDVELLDVPEADRAKGEFHFRPTRNASYRLVATNEAGAVADSLREVTLAPPRVVSFTASPTEIVAGQGVELSWSTEMGDQLHLDILDTGYLVEETLEPFTDISEEGATTLEMTTECFVGTGAPVINHHSCVAFDLPGGFTFPFGGVDQDRVRVYGGLISFSPSVIPSENPGANVAFPTTDAAKHFAHLAPFWDALVWPPAVYPNGNLHLLYRPDPSGDSVVIQWTDISLNGTAYHDSIHLNFQVILWANGDFEYRYGRMEHDLDNSFHTDLANGSSATIGFQTPARDSFAMLGYNNTRVRGVLYGRSFRFRPIAALPASGSLVWHPYSPTDQIHVTLTVSREGLEDSTTRTITVNEKPAVTLEQIPEEPVLVNHDFRIGWSTERANLVEIFNGAGIEVCRVDNQTSVNQGFCTLQEPDEADHTYRLKVSGASGVFVEREIRIRAYEDFGISSFVADEESVEVGQGVSLSWTTYGATSMSIEANGTELDVSELEVEGDTIHFPSVLSDTTFILRVSNALGMIREEVLAIETWSIEFTVTPRETKVRPGDLILVDVVATALDGGSPPVVFGTMPMVEQTDPSAAFVDISTMDGVVQLSLSPTATNTVNDISFPAGFRFPYFDGIYDAVRTHVDGYISFSTDGNTSFNQPLPISDTPAYRGVHLAPFWDDLHPRSDNGVAVGSMWTLHDGDRFIIQWKKMSMNTGSANGTASAAVRAHDLNFQVILHSNGDFEYRYGTMAGLPSGDSHTSCYPSTCENEANGASATIGYQDPTGSKSVTLHYGGTNNGAENLPFHGGLANRSFMVARQVGSGTIPLVPYRSGSYEFCSYSGERMVCKSFEIDASFGIESFEISATSVAMGVPVTLSWATEGGKTLRIFQGDTLIHTVTDPAEIDSGSFQRTPLSNTTFTLDLEAASHKATSSVFVEVIRSELQVSASTTSVFPGTPLTLSWKLDVLDPAYQPILITPMQEIFGEGNRFGDFDISEDPEAVQLLTTSQGSNTALLEFEDGFVFPYLGEEMRWVRVSSEGYLSFSTDTAASATNQLLPDDGNLNRRVHIAAFWDNLHPRNLGRVLAKRVAPDTYVVQWSHTSLNQGSSNSNTGDLNFQIVLRTSGEFEFHYGEMLPPRSPATNATHCSPLTCEKETNGSSATIGYQDTSGTAAFVLHYGGGNPAPENRAVGGGLAHRSWRYTPWTTSGSVQVAPWDTTEYVLCAVDTVTKDIRCAEPVVVEAEWGIASFEASPAAVLRDNPVSLSWNVEGLDELWLMANGVELQRYTRENMPLNGSYQHTPNVTTTYTLEGTSMGRPVIEERLVELRTLNLSLTPPTGRLFPGQNISVNWTLEQLEPGPFAVTSPMVEIDAKPGSPGAYEDISGLPGAIDASLSANNGHTAHTLPFDFPYFGAYYRDIRVQVSGFLSFDPDTTTVRSSNIPLPTPAADRHVHMAIFWDQLFRRGPDKIWLYQPSADSFIIQWTNFNRTGGSSATNLYDLNFQIVLYADGAFEYRYGKMAPPPPPFSNTTCYPSTCELEANGSSATIGYQTVDGSYGYTFHFGGQGAANVRELPGGLNNRSFRFEPARSGSTDFVLERSGDVVVCGSVGTFKECKSVYVEAVADPGDLTITELMIDPQGGSANQWFEVRNLSKRVLDLEGFEIRTNEGSHQIANSLLVGSGEYLTFASSTGVPFTPSYVYGELPFGTQVEDLRVDAGTATISSVNWAVNWTVPAERTLHLDPSHITHGLVSHNSFDSWCEGTTTGTPGQRSVGCLSPFYDVETYSTLPFIDISTTGTRVVDMENWFGTLELPVSGFTMPFFDTTVSDFWVSVNGWIGLTPSRPGGSDNAAPSSFPRGEATLPAPPLFSVLWDSYVCNNTQFSCSFTYQRGTFNGQDMVIVQWTNYRRSQSITGHYPGTLTFQAQLWADGTIVTAIADAEPGDIEGSDAWGYYRGGSSWVGLEGPDRDYISGHHRIEADMSHRTIVFTRK